MVDSGTIKGDASKISSLFSKYSSEIGNLSSNSVWEGDSKNNAISQMKNFVSEFQSPISNQLETLSGAVEKYKTYKEKKEELERTKQSKSSALSADPKADVSSYDSKINTLETELKTLKSEIEQALSTVASAKINVTTSNISVDTGGFSVGNFVYYRQGDYKQAYGWHGTISSAGCGPTSMAMVLTALLGKKISPVEAANYSAKHGYRASFGTSWGFFGSMAKAYGLDCVQGSGNSSDIMSALKQGKLVVASMKPGHFTKGGHFIVLRGIDKNGKIIVADPAKPARNGSWDANIVINECKQSFAISGGTSGGKKTTVQF